MSPRSLATVFAALAAFALAAPGCDSNTDDPADGAATICDFGFAETNAAGKDFGQACASDAECKFGECLMPGADGNIENAQFGFCTRGCNCDNAAGSQLSDTQKDTLTCLDPSGFSGKKRHVALKCANLAECTAVDAGWTDCKTPSTGGARPICQAL